NTIMYLLESPHEKGVLWAGTDDGLVHLTKDGGANWSNVTPAGLAEGIINSIEISPHDPATAYIAVMRYKFLDLSPYIYKTTNYGASWTKITNGITDPHTFVRVVREDHKRKGLLYAGTETGLYISFDDGQNWQSFQLNLPVVAINDLTIQDNDLVVATAGRSFWILDDVSSLQSVPQGTIPFTLVKPKDSYLLFGGSASKPVPGLGQNPKQGVTLDYYIDKEADSLDLTLDILSEGQVIRTYTNKASKDFKSWPGGPSKPAVLPAKKGFNRFTWNFRRNALPAVDKVFVYGSYAGSRVGPGTYQIRLTFDGAVAETDVTVLPNPKIMSSEGEYDHQQETLARIESTIKSIHESVNQMRSAKTQLKTYAKLLKGQENAKDLLDKGKELTKRIDTWEENLIQPKQKTFQDVINYHNQLNAELMNLKNYVDAPEPKVTQGAEDRLKDLLSQWNTFDQERKSIVETEMQEYNALFKSLDIPAIVLPEKN
ncbi:MAG: glycosyl hydrolase, partial [Eudoraea sp.]|nr:glycosyl hydrolase [Eudoraea sp.]